MEEERQFYHPDEEATVQWPDNIEISQLCRICANTSEYLIPIFDGEGMENELELKIKKHLPIQVSKTDTLPMNLCYQCASTLIAWHDLTLGCIEADKRLRDLVNCREERSLQSKNVDCDGSESARGVGDIEIEFEEEVTTTPSTSTQVEVLESTSTSDKLLPTSDKHEDVKKQNQVTEDETIANNSGGEDAANERHLEDQLPEKSTSSTDPSTNNRIALIKVCKKSRKAKLCECSVCGKKFNFTNNLRVHMYSHSDVRQFSCELCGKAFKRKDHVRNHRKIKHEGKSITPRPGYVRPKKTLICNICGNVFSSKLALFDHLRRHTGETPFLCSSCGKGFPAKCALRNHQAAQCSGISTNLRNNSTNEKYVCDVCNEEFISYVSFYRHKLKHNKSFICDICGKCFALKGQLKCHQVIHSEERPHKCDKCSKTFKTKTILFAHQKMHTDERPYPCPHCSWKCRKHADLVVHIRTHTGEKPYECSICGRGFAQAGDMRKHKITHNILKY